MEVKLLFEHLNTAADNGRVYYKVQRIYFKVGDFIAKLLGNLP